MEKINIKNILLILSMIFMSSCYVYHKSTINKLELCYNGTYSGIDTLIDIKGYYKMDLNYSDEKEKINNTVVFYDDGMFLFNPSLEYMRMNSINLDDSGGGQWGNYKLSNDTIIGQYITLSANTSTCKNVYYKIIDKHTIQRIKTIYHYNNKTVKINYSEAYFVPFDNLPKPNKSRIKGKKWFWCNEEDYNKWKRGK